MKLNQTEKERIIIRIMAKSDVQGLADSFLAEGLRDKSVELFRGYYQEQIGGMRECFVAQSGPKHLGYATVVWQSGYRPFAEAKIPELKDFNVVPSARGGGVGAALMTAIEERVARDYDSVGLGVGLSVDYGNAQRVYVKRGYVPDGRGLMYDEKPVDFGSTVPNDHGLALYMVKELKPQ